jgi:HD-like signal output (HDOD) protein/CheY-like chemotaxis protein
MGNAEGTLRRILFVDDDANVLTGLRNVLRSRRREWDMVFAIGPNEALTKLAEGRFDVVVSDMRMPGMDGATLLATVKQLQPWAVRLILSGQTELDSVMKSVFIAHMFLSKPCDPVALQSVVDRACRLQAILASDELRATAGRVEMLPAAPKTYTALNEALMQDNCSVASVAGIIERDIGLCAKLLQLVNSAFFGLPRRISSLAETVTYLGISTIKNLAFALEAFSNAAQSSGLSESALLALQSHSLLTGQIARNIEARDAKKAEEAFLAGVLHDVGWLLKAREAPDAAARQPVDRALLGAYLLGLWGLSHSIIEAVAYHNEPQLLAHSSAELVDVIYVAHHLANEVGGLAKSNVQLDLPYLARMGITEAQLLEMRALAGKTASALSSTSNEAKDG